MLPTSVYHLRI